MKYYMGIEGGGSSTKFLLLSLDDDKIEIK